jgi:hypothetical protein
MSAEAVIARLREVHRAELKKSTAARPGTHSIKIRDPLGSNNVKYNTWYYGNKKVHGDRFMWCAVYQAWCAARTGIPMTVIPKMAGVMAIKAFYEKKGRVHQQPKVGDLMLVVKSATAHHIGFVEMVKSDGRFTCIEGNVSSRVMRVKHRVGEFGLAGFARPDYAKVPLTGLLEEDDMPDEKTFKKWVREVVDAELDRRFKGGVIFGQENVGGTLAAIADHVDKLRDEVRQHDH